MKHSEKTKRTALMFSAAVIGAGMLTGCGSGSEAPYCVYGPPSYFESGTSDEETEPAAPVPETEPAETTAPVVPAKQIDFRTMTEDEILNLPDEDLIALAQQFSAMDYHSVPLPAYRSFVPDNRKSGFAFIDLVFQFPHQFMVGRGTAHPGK